MEHRQRIDQGRQSHRPPERLAGLSNPTILIRPDEDRSQKEALHACALSQLKSDSVGHAAVISKMEHVKRTNRSTGLVAVPLLLSRLRWL
ncbi:MAG: hypothetical protein Q9172_003293 [Xanthocarpia lactea]